MRNVVVAEVDLEAREATAIVRVDTDDEMPVRKRVVRLANMLPRSEVVSVVAVVLLLRRRCRNGCKTRAISLCVVHARRHCVAAIHR